MPAVLSTLRLGDLKRKKKENLKNICHLNSRCDVVPSLENTATITIEMKENTNPCRPLPNANNLAMKEVLVLHDDVKVLLPPSSFGLQDSDEIITKKAPPDLEESEPAFELHRTTSMLSVNAPEFQPGSKIHFGKFSPGSSLFASPTSAAGFGSSSTTIGSFPPPPRSLTSMTLPCIGIDNKLRQYVWRLDKVGELVPDMNLSVPPPRVVGHGSFYGPSIVIPVRCNFQLAWGSLVVNQFKPLRPPIEGKS